MSDIISVITAAVLGYLFKYLETFKNDKSKAKAYRIILIMDFEQNISILEEHDLSSNPFKDLKYGLWNKNNIDLAQYIPKETVMYGKWLRERGVEKWDDPKDCVYHMVKRGNELLKSIKE